MADRTALGMIGLMLGAATIVVATVGGLVISYHMNGRLQIEDKLSVSALSETSVR